MVHYLRTTLYINRFFKQPFIRHIANIASMFSFYFFKNSFLSNLLCSILWFSRSTILPPLDLLHLWYAIISQIELGRWKTACIVNIFTFTLDVYIWSALFTPLHSLHSYCITQLYAFPSRQSRYPVKRRYSESNCYSMIAAFRSLFKMTLHK